MAQLPGGAHLEQPRKIFLSYRREDSAAAAGRLGDRLTLEFEGAVFMDVDGIPLGTDFVKRLRAEVAGCDILLAVIGPRWLNVADGDGRPRLDNPNDFVRVEIATALQRDIPVIPILLDGTKIPRPDQLPSDLQDLPFRNGLDVRQGSFHSDVGRLIRELKGTGSAIVQPLAEQGYPDEAPKVIPLSRYDWAVSEEPEQRSSATQIVETAEARVTNSFLRRTILALAYLIYFISVLLGLVGFVAIFSFIAGRAEFRVVGTSAAIAFILWCIAGWVRSQAK
jgi:hypothetical protein